MGTTLGSVICDSNRVALHAENTDFLLVKPDAVYIIAACVEPNSSLASSDLYSINWRYRRPNSILPWEAITLTSSAVRNSGSASSALLHGTLVSAANKRCTNNGSHVDGFTENDVNSFGTGATLTSGQNSEMQVAVTFGGARPGETIELMFRMNVSGVDEDSNLVRVIVPDRFDYRTHPNQKLASVQNGWGYDR